jgi:hypothetical protein
MFDRPKLINATVTNLAQGEEIIWEDRACFQSFRAHKIFFPILGALPFSLVSLFMGATFIFAIISSDEGLGMLFVIIPFFLVFQIPMIAALVQASKIRAAWEDTYYVVTNQRVIIQSAGVVRREIKSSFFSEISGVFLKIDFMDKKFDTGTIKFLFHNLNFMSMEGNHAGRAAALNEIRHIDNVEDVFVKLQNKITEMRNNREAKNV